jgi:hypothetical protein
MDEMLQGRIKRLRNLPSFKYKTDEEIEEYLKTREPKPKKEKVEVPEVGDLLSDSEKAYNARYNQKIVQLKDEYGRKFKNACQIDYSIREC